eukprot:SAG22_NODE_903_length_6590_cov_2.976121_5_plen_664_part_00
MGLCCSSTYHDSVTAAGTNVTAKKPRGNKGLIMMASEDKSISFVDVESMKPIKHIARIWESSVNCAAFSPNGRWAVIGSSDPAVVVVDVRTWAIKRLHIVHKKAILCCAFSPDGGRILLGSADSTASVIEIPTELDSDDPESDPWQQAWNTEVQGQAAAAAAKDGSLPELAWPMVHHIKGVHSGWVLAARFSPDGQQVVLSSYDDTATLVDLQHWEQLITQAEADRRAEEEEVAKRKGAPGGKTASQRKKDKEKKDIRKRREEALKALYPEEEPEVLAARIEQIEKEEAEDPTMVKMSRTVRLKVVRTLERPAGGFGLPGGGTELAAHAAVAASCGEAVYDAGEAIHTDWIRAICFSPQPHHGLTAGGSGLGPGRHRDPPSLRLVLGSDDKTWSVTDLKVWQEAALAEARPSKPTRAAAAPAPGGAALAAEAAEAQFKNWDGIDVFPCVAKSWVTAADWSPDGKLLALGCEDGTALLIDATEPMRDSAGAVIMSESGSGKLVPRYRYPVLKQLELAHHACGLRAACFSPDSKLLLLSSEDHTASVVNVDPSSANKWQVVSTLRVHRGWIRAGCFTPSEAQIRHTDNLRRVRIWGRGVAHQGDPLMEAALRDPDAAAAAAAADGQPAAKIPAGADWREFDPAAARIARQADDPSAFAFGGIGDD